METAKRQCIANGKKGTAKEKVDGKKGEQFNSTQMAGNEPGGGDGLGVRRLSGWGRTANVESGLRRVQKSVNTTYDGEKTRNHGGEDENRRVKGAAEGGGVDW